MIVGEGHVEDVRDSAGTNNIVVVEEMTAFCVRVDGHVLLYAGQGTAARDCTQEVAELGRVKGITKCKEVGEKRDLFWGEVIERGKVASLVDLQQGYK